MARALEATEGRQQRWMIIAAVLFAAIAAVLIFVALNSGDEGGTSGATTETVVATEQINPNTRITGDMLELRAIPEDQVLSGAYLATADVEGLVARYPIQAGAQVTTSSIGTDEIEDENDVGLVVPEGKRAAAIEVTEMTSVGGLLLPGNRVDVIAVIGNENTDNLAEPLRSVVVAQNLEVLSVAQEAQEPLPAPAEGGESAGESSTGTSGERPDDVEQQPDAQTVTLAMTPQQVLLFAALQVENQDRQVSLYLALRGAGDDATTPAQALDITDAIFARP
jgi:pilus assembly protein CpaB